MSQSFKDFQVSCNNCNLDTICLPRGLSGEETESLNSVVKNNSTLQRGEYIYRQGDSFKGIIAIKSGTAKQITSDSDGHEHILDVLLPGEIAGFDGLNKKKYNCSVVALEQMSYCELPSENFDILCQEAPTIAREFFKHYSECIGGLQDQIISSKRPADEKLALFLINLSERLNRLGFSSMSFTLPLTRQEMGNHLGMTLETVSRMLQHFQNEGLIKVQRKYIEIKDIDSLKSLCHHDVD
ncbi:MAG: helix-turn-helix domain-containing protein [Methylococcales bacterium]|nr:helix-turn-helix domain-containing protein [Methylococcales bacterium]